MDSNTFYTLTAGNKIPLMGLGTSEMGNVEEVVYHSIKDGARLIDTAAMYGNEDLIGKGIHKAISEGIIKREDLFVITKLNTCDRGAQENAIKESLKKLQLSYVDLYLDHWPFAFKYDGENKVNKQPMHVVWPKIEKLQEKGYAKAIGVSNYNVQSLCNLLSFCNIKPSALEVEFHPYFYQKHLLDFCNKEKIRVIAFNPLVRGSYVKSLHAAANLNLLDEAIVKEIGKKYSKTSGQVALNWLISLGIVPIPRTSRLTRMKENLGAMSFRLSKEDHDKISELNKNYRFCSTTTWKDIDCIDLFA